MRCWLKTRIMKLNYKTLGKELPNINTTNRAKNSLANILRKNGLVLLALMLVTGLNSSYSQTILPTNTSPTGNGVAPVGWTVLVGSTDISNKDFWAGWVGYPWYAPTVVDPPNLHTVWVTGFYSESVGTTITGLTSGVEYNMSFYMAEMRSNAGGGPTIYDGTLQATIGGVDHLFPFSGGIDNSWSLQTLTFTATAASMAISFKYAGAAPVNGNFWNISFGGDVVEIGCDELTTTVSGTEFCFGEELTLEATSINGGTVTWDGGVVDGDPFTPPVGVTTYTATSDNDLDCIFEVEITVHDLPETAASADDSTVCLGDMVTLTGLGADSYTWDLGVTDGVAFSPPLGVTTYTVTGTSVEGCESTATIDITVNDLPTVVATASDIELCIGEELTLTGSGADSYVWDLGVTDGVVFTPVDIGATTYTVTGTDGEGCVNTASIDVTIYDLPTVTASVDESDICLGESIILTGGGADSYTWDMGATDGVAFTPVTLGTIDFTVTGTSAEGCENTAVVSVNVNALPETAASADDSTVCIGDMVTLTGLGADSYTWDLGVTDGVAFAPPLGVTTYTVTGTSAEGCQSTATIDITVNDLPTVIAAASDIELCIGEELTLTGSGADMYDWDLGVTDGVTFTPVDLGITTYTVTGTDVEGCINTASIDVNVLDLPTVTASVDDTDICIGEAVVLTGGGADLYDWDMGATDGVAFTPAASGTIDFTVIGTDASGCENTAVVTVNVHDLPVVGGVATPDEVCLGESLTLNGTGADTYVWDLGVINGVPFTPGVLGTTTYTVTGTSEFGCVGTGTITVSVIDCEPVLPAFTYENVCVGSCIQLTDQSSGGTPVAWEWDFGGAVDPGTSSEQNPEICFNIVGSFNVQLTVTSAGGAISSTVNTIEVYENPTINATLDTIIDAGGSAILVASTVSSGIFSWEPENTLDCPDCQITNADPLDSTMYTVTLIDENGCSGSDNVMVLVNFIKGVGVPTAFTPNGDGNNDVLFVKGYGLAGIQFVVYNRYGEVVFKSTEQSIGWDGTFKNREENPGVFTWVLHYDFIDGSSGFQKGNTTLIR
ncbi:MAG: T9SS type B sorting domain-containing protein [Crocinitomix sp.]|nr:T9SS type B sorting domain-containing protein [Crocinitomix sp.]